MKKVLFFFVLLSMNFLNAQTTCFRGPSTIGIGTPTSYSVNFQPASTCANCYHWSISSGTAATIVGANDNNSVTVQASSAGSFTIKVVYFAEGVCTTCFRTINSCSGCRTGISVSPNPVKSVVNFDGENLESYNISVFDLNGREVISNQQLKDKISMERLEKGIYKYMITNKDGEIEQEGKLLKD